MGAPNWDELSDSPAGGAPDWDALSLEKPPKEQRGAVAEIGRQIVGGIVTRAPAMIGGALEWWVPQGSDLEDAGRVAKEYWTEKEKAWEPDLEGRGFVSSTLIKGASQLGPSLAGMGAAMINPVLGGAAVATIFGGQQAQDTYDNGIKAGLSEADASEAAYKTGLIEGFGETVADVAGAKLLTGGGKLLSGLIGKGGMSGAIRAATDPRMAAQFARDWAANAVIQSGTEFGQGYGQAVVERNAGISTGDPLEQGAEGAQSALGMSVLLGPLAAVGHSSAAKRRAMIGDALNDPAAPLPIRMAAGEYVAKDIEPTVGKEAAQSWLQSFHEAAVQDRDAQQQPAAAPDVAAPSGPAGLIGYQPGPPLVVFPDGSTMTGAEAERYRADGMTGQPAPAQTIPEIIATVTDPAKTLDESIVAAVDSVAASEDEFADLLKSEQSDLAYLRRDAATEAAKAADFARAKEQQTDIQIDQANALTRVSGFDDQTPTAMQLALQRAKQKNAAPPVQTPSVPSALPEPVAAAPNVAAQPDASSLRLDETAVAATPNVDSYLKQNAAGKWQLSRPVELAVKDAVIAEMDRRNQEGSTNAAQAAESPLSAVQKEARQGSPLPAEVADVPPTKLAPEALSGQRGAVLDDARQDVPQGKDTAQAVPDAVAVGEGSDRGAVGIGAEIAKHIGGTDPREQAAKIKGLLHSNAAGLREVERSLKTAPEDRIIALQTQAVQHEQNIAKLSQWLAHVEPNPEASRPNPVAESQARAVSDSRDGGVAPTQDKAAPAHKPLTLSTDQRGNMNVTGTAETVAAYKQELQAAMPGLSILPTNGVNGEQVLILSKKADSAAIKKAVDSINAKISAVKVRETPPIVPESATAQDYTVSTARYSKGNMLVRTPSNDGYKTRAARLAHAIAHGRFTGREGGYVMSQAAAKRFEKLYAEGWDASVITRELQPPKNAQDDAAANATERSPAAILEPETSPAEPVAESAPAESKTIAEASTADPVTTAVNNLVTALRAEIAPEVARVASDKPVATKEPWEMSFDEYLNTFDAEGREWEGSRATEHRASVQKAVNEGKMSADAARGDYPDIASDARRKSAPSRLERIVEAARGVTDAEIDNSGNNLITRFSGELKKLFGGKKMSLKEIGSLMNFFGDILSPFDLKMQIGPNFNPRGQVEAFGTMRKEVAAVIENVYRDVLYAPGQGEGVFASLPSEAAKERESRNTEDAGAELTYNKRNRLNRGLRWADISDQEAALRVKEVTKAKVYPKPDYAALVDGGMNPIIAHLVKQIYDSIAPAPATSIAPTDEQLQTYIAATNRVMDGVMAWAQNNAEYKSEFLPTAEGVKLLDAIYPAGWRENKPEIQLLGGNKFLGAIQPSYDERVKANKAIKKGWPGAREAWEVQGYAVLETAKSVSMTVMDDGKKTYLRVDGSYDKRFDSPEEAQAAIDKMRPWLLVDKRKNIVSDHESEAEATEAAREKARRSKEGGIKDAGISVTSAERIGPDRRMEGEDVTSDRLLETFGFKGVNFGTWMKGNANKAERQLHLNHAYDSMLDLAEILNVPPKAMSLNGMLGLAIGAQGGAGAAAHFVPGVNEINLTRTSGAGSLAHEFGHAVDHYFARLGALDRQKEPFLTEHAKKDVGGELRPEIVAKFKAIVDAMNERKETQEEYVARQRKRIEKLEYNVNSWLKAIRRDFENGTIKKSDADERIAKREESLAKLDKLIERIKALDLGDGQIAVGSGKTMPPVLMDIIKLSEDTFGRVLDMSNIKGLRSNIDPLVFAKSQQAADVAHEPQMTKTDYARNAAKLDEEKGGKPYWNTNLEKFARAFDAFVSDTLDERAAKNTYLSHAGRGGETVPAGTERETINQAFRELVATIKTKETDKGVALESRSDLSGREFWRKIKAGETFTEKELEDAYSIGRRGTTRAGQPVRSKGSYAPHEAARKVFVWTDEIAGFGAYRTYGEEVAPGVFHVSVVPEELAAQYRDDADILGYTFTKMDDGKYRLDVSDPKSDTPAFKEIEKRGRLERTGHAAGDGLPYYRVKLDNRYTTSRTLLQEAVRRLALHIGEVPTIVQMGRETGARADNSLPREFSADAIARQYSKSPAATLTNETPATIRAGLWRSLGKATVDRLEQSGLLVIAADAESLPPGKSISATGTAFYDGKTAYVIANRMRPETAVREILHEIGTHAGLDGMLGPKGFKALSNRVRFMEKAKNKLVMESFAFVREVYPEYSENSWEFMQEALAHLGQNADVRAKPWWKEMIAAVRRWLVQLGYGGLIRTSDIEDMVLHSLKVAAQGNQSEDSLGMVPAMASKSAGLRVVDLFGNGSRVQHFDDKRGLFYEAQKYPSGRTGWRAGELVDGVDYWLSNKEFGSMAEAQSAVRGLRISNTAKQKNADKYGVIPALWAGEAKRVAKAIIDAGIGVERFSASTQSASKYVYLSSGLKVRIADHSLPGAYDQPDVDYRYGGDIKALVEEIRQEEEGAPTPDSGELGSRALSDQDAGAVSMRADESGQLTEPAQSGSGAGSNAMLSEKAGAGKTAFKAVDTESAENPSILESRIIGDSGRQYTPDQEAMFKQTGREVDQVTMLGKLREWASVNWRQGLFDQFQPVRAISAKGYTLLRLSKGATGAFEAFMQHGKLSLKDGAYDADTTGGVMQEVFFPLGKETTDFLYWIAGNRAERLAMEGKERLFSVHDIAAAKSLATGTTDFDYVLANGQSTRDRRLIYRDSLAKFNAFNKNVMDMAEQSGLIDAASRHLWEHEFYVPFYRLIDDTDGGVRGMNIKQGVVRQQAFKKLKGGKEGLNDLLANTLMNWAHLIDASAKNRGAKETLEAAARLGAAQPAQAGDKNTVWYMDGGKKAEYTIDDPELLVALNALDYSGLRGPIMDALQKPKHWLTIGVTASPFFKVRNLIRDSVQAVATSGLSYNVAGNIVNGISLTNRDRQEYVSALAGGGLIRFGTMLEGNEAARTRQLIKKGAKDEHILNNEGKIRAFYDKFLEPGISAYNEIGNRGEEINRMSLYDQMIKSGADHATASLMARDLMDFSMQGSWTSIRFLAQTVPFMNARLEGMYKLGRAAKGDPAKFGAVLGAVSLFSLALLAAYSDDDDWKKREDWDRDNYWWFKVGGVAFRIPKPFEIGAIATLAERSAELMFDKEMTGKRFRQVTTKLLADQLSMNPTPQLVKPILDIYANKDSFSGRPIETMGMERLDKERRFTSSTSMPARGLSTATGGALSPVQIDHLVRGYFAWLGAFAVGTADLAVRMASDGPDRPSRDYWKFATGGMIAETDSASSRYVSQMYDQAKEIETAYGTWRDMSKQASQIQGSAKQDALKDAQEYRKENADKIAKHNQVGSAKRQISAMNERIRVIERSDKTASEKRALINNIQKLKDQAARRVVATRRD